MRPLHHILAYAAVALLALASDGPGGPAAAGAIFTVNSTADTSDAVPGDGVCADGLGACTLRAAIEEANALPGLDTIHFSIGTGVQTISSGDTLAIFDPVVIDGTTQPSFTGKPIIELNGSSAAQGAYGLYVVGGGATIRGLVINHFTEGGIGLFGEGGNRIAGNFIGTDVAGTTAAGNGFGLDITYSNGNIIGGTAPADRNVISGNGNGFWMLDANSNQIQGNYIGTDFTGNADLGNTATGLAMQGGNNLVGGTTAGAGNVISGNGIDGGIVLTYGSNNIFQGNLIGTDRAGTTALPNQGSGISISPVGSSDNNLVGGDSPAARNVISGNDGPGLVIGGNTVGNIVSGNFIGVDRTGTVALPNFGDGVQVNNTVGTIIGSASLGARNVISGNTGNGVALYWTYGGSVLRDNFIGTDASGLLPIPNGANGVLLYNSGDNSIGQGSPVTGNVIAFNGGDGVRVEGALATANMVRANSIHANTGKGIENVAGGNGEIAPPIITSVNPVEGTSLPGCLIDLYSDSEDEGRIYYGSATAYVDGNWTYNAPVGGPKLTATCTVAGATSEFSLPFPNACAPDDADCEGIAGIVDNCPSQPNPGQEDADSDGVGDVCEPPSPDVDCNGIVNATDALKILRRVAGLPVQQTQPCEFIGQVLPGGNIMGDVNCNGSTNAVDALVILRLLAQLTVVLPTRCPLPP